MNVSDVFTNRIGPLPAWAWGGIAGGVVLGWRVWKGRGEAKADATDEVAPSSDDTYATATARPDLLSGRDTAGYPAVGSAAPDPSAVYTDPTPPSWVTDLIDRITTLPGDILASQPPISVVVENPPPVDTPTAPASSNTPAPPPPAPAPAPAYLQTLGPWAAKPADGTVNDLTARGYRVVQRGDRKWIAVDRNFKAG